VLKANKKEFQMKQNENVHVWRARIVAFLVGGLLVFGVLSIAVMSPLKSRNAALTKQIDQDQNGAVRLLEEANTLVKIGSYEKAKKSLDTLFEMHPASSEASDGANLYKSIEDTLREDEVKWAAAVDSVRATWEESIAGSMRDQFEKDRLLMEANMTDTLAKEWEDSKDKVREEWASL
jgi:flagellar biosynthesis/type III secretory pathway M-ring protein FliF/YscJ